MLLAQGVARYSRRLRILESHLLSYTERSTTAGASVAAVAAISRASIASMAGREVAVVGGGISGLYCASLLSKQGHRVTVFDLGKHAPGEDLSLCCHPQLLTPPLMCSYPCCCNPTNTILVCSSSY
jgi:hypothetical protein